MMWWEARPRLRRWVFLLIPGVHRWRMRALQRRILMLEIKHFPQYFPVEEKPLTRASAYDSHKRREQGTLSRVLKDYYKPVPKGKVTASNSLLEMNATYTLDSICQDYFLPVAQNHACGALRLNTGRDAHSGVYWAVVSCDGCRQTAYMKLDPRDYWTASRGQMNTDGILYAIKSFFAVTVEEMHHAIEAS